MTRPRREAEGEEQDREYPRWLQRDAAEDDGPSAAGNTDERLAWYFDDPA